MDRGIEDHPGNFVEQDMHNIKWLTPDTWWEVACVSFSRESFQVVTYIWQAYRTQLQEKGLPLLSHSIYAFRFHLEFTLV